MFGIRIRIPGSGSADPDPDPNQNEADPKPSLPSVKSIFRIRLDLDLLSFFFINAVLEKLIYLGLGGGEISEEIYFPSHL